jgi:DNA-binding GntR family transcriptional regulator
MAELEAMCAGLAAERMTPADRHGLEAIHEELRVLSYTGNPDRFHEVNERFHNAINGARDISSFGGWRAFRADGAAV